jgi:uncharacterized membrane protein YeaQ/YmgE (transglycosylase-associated protein family)
VDTLWFLIVLAIVGGLAGALARAVVPGPDPMSIFGTICLGIVGSFIGGLIVGLIFRPDDGEAFAPVGFLGSVGGAVVALLLWRAMGGAGGRTARRI